MEEVASLGFGNTHCSSAGQEDSLARKEARGLAWLFLNLRQAYSGQSSQLHQISNI